MKLWIFSRIDQLTTEYHPAGGLVVVAKDHAAMCEAVNSIPSAKLTDDEWQSALVYNLVDDVPPLVRIFPDAGCC